MLFEFVVKKYFNKLFWHYRLYKENKSDKIYFSQVYDNAPHESIMSNDCVFLVTGKAKLWYDAVIHGGLADRLKGMASVYTACRDVGRNFKIVHTYPYLLQDFLIPNLYDWTTNPESVVYNNNAVSPHMQRHSCNEDTDMIKYQIWKLKKILGKSKKCVHLYSNAITVDDDCFRHIFHELFKPSPLLEDEINKNLEAIGGAYISLSFRFTHLLGDPVDTYMKELSSVEKENLIEKLVVCINDFHIKYPDRFILVNSDSNIFLSRIKGLKKKYIYIVPGVPIHIDQTRNATVDSYLKTFVDFFMISKAEKVFQVRTTEMRCSGFPKCAAIIGNKPFEIVCI